MFDPRTFEKSILKEICHIERGLKPCTDGYITQVLYTYHKRNELQNVPKRNLLISIAETDIHPISSDYLNEVQ